MTNPQIVNINPDVNTVGIAVFTESSSAAFLSYFNAVLFKDMFVMGRVVSITRKTV